MVPLFDGPDIESLRGGKISLPRPALDASKGATEPGEV